MKKIFIQQLSDFLSNVINKNHWETEPDFITSAEELIERSVDKVYNASFEDCTKEEMKQFAKTNLSCLLAYMHIDCQKRGLHSLDSTSIYNALKNFNCLWPFKGKEVTSIKTYSSPESQNFTWYY
jgi:Golgi nucleoside diphosphatase